MGSKASGEPSLLLSVSILHALRAAVKAARQEVTLRACMDGGPVGDRSRGEDFVALPGPASIIRLKEACGPFSAAKILRAALDDEDVSQAMDGWVLMH